VVYLVMGLALFRGEDYEEVAARMIEPLARLGARRGGDPVPTASAITQARKRLGPQVMREVFHRTAVPVADLLTARAHLGSLPRSCRLPEDGVIGVLLDQGRLSADWGQSSAER
jgi:hypothetical protein